MGDTRNPGRELPGIGVAPLAYGHDCLDEGFLKHVIGHVLVLYDIQYIGKHAVLMPAEQCVEGGVVTVCVSGHQLFVGKPCHLLHCVVNVG